MTALDHNPSNKNYLSPLVFQFQIKRAPNVNFFVQAVTLPGVSLDAVDTFNPFVTLPYTGDHITYETLSLNFKVNEDLSNWTEIYEWIRDTGFPESYDQHARISSQSTMSGGGLKSDISLLIANSNKNLQFEVYFKDAFPVFLSSLQFDATSQDLQYLDATCSFRYTSYDIRNL